MLVYKRVAPTLCFLWPKVTENWLMRLSEEKLKISLQIAKYGSNVKVRSDRISNRLTPLRQPFAFNQDTERYAI
jgi:hypothetical protein